MQKINSIYSNIIQNLHWIFANYDNTITFTITNIVEGFEYYINTLWNKVTYTAQAGDTEIDILTNLKDNFEGTNITASIIENKLVLTKSIDNYFYFFEISDNMDYNKYLDGRIFIQDQNSPQPNKTYITTKIITGLNKISEGDFNYENNTFYNKLSKTFTLNIQTYGTDSFDYINYISNILGLYEVVNKQDLISYYNIQPIIDISNLINNGIETRYSLDIFCYITEKINTSQVIGQNAIINLNIEH